MNRNTISYLVTILLLAVTSIFSIRLFFREKTFNDRADIRSFPYRIGEWKGADITITEEEYKILETRNLISREYTDPTGDKLYLFIVYSETNRSVFHPPEVCMIGSGVVIVDKQSEKIDLGGRSFITNKIYAEKNKARQIILYAYKAGDRYTSNFYFQQVYLALHQVFAMHVPGATIRASMIISKDEETTLATLKNFLSETAKIVDDISRI